VEAPAPQIDRQREPAARRAGRLTRSSRDRVVGGVAAGIGERVGVDPTVVRLAFVALSLAAGIGVVLYLAAYLVSVEPEPGLAVPRPRTSARQALAIGLIVLGVLVLLRQMGLWFGDRLVWPVVLAAIGSAVIWTRGDEADRARWSRLVRRLPEASQTRVAGSAPRVRLVAGAALMLAGLWQFLRSNDAGNLRDNAPLAVAATLGGAAVILGPWFWRLARQLAE
jgi:phage shock protein PspC (stress-responsive transcriptional regulator)